MKYQVFSVNYGKWRSWYRKKYYWVVYDEEVAGPYAGDYTWTYNGACNDAELYMMKLNDGRYFK
jgi:hypothetical protein